MNNRIKKFRLSRTTEHRLAMLRTMVTQLLTHERIKTTVPKAKALKQYADKVITMGKEGTLHARQRAGAIVRTDEVVEKLFSTIADRYKERPGGYTRVMRCGYRMGDNAPMAIIELVDREGEIRPARPVGAAAAPSASAARAAAER